MKLASGATYHFAEGLVHCCSRSILSRICLYEEQQAALLNSSGKSKLETAIPFLGLRCDE